MPADRSATAMTELEEVEWAVALGRPPEPVKARASGVEIPQGRISPGMPVAGCQRIGYAMYLSQDLTLSEEGLPTVEREPRPGWSL